MEQKSQLHDASSERLAVSPNEAARLLGLGRTSIYVELGAGRLKSVKVGQRRLIPMTALHDWLDQKQRSEAQDDAA